MMPLNPWTMKWNTSSWPGRSRPLTNPPDLKHHPSPNPLPMAIWVRKNAQIKWLLAVARFGSKKTCVFLWLAQKTGKKTCRLQYLSKINTFSWTAWPWNTVKTEGLKFCKHYELSYRVWFLMGKFSSNKKMGGLSDIVSSYIYLHQFLCFTSRSETTSWDNFKTIFGRQEGCTINFIRNWWFLGGMLSTFLSFNVFKRLSKSLCGLPDSIGKVFEPDSRFCVMPLMPLKYLNPLLKVYQP